MATNRALAGHSKARKATLSATESVRRRKQLCILKAFGSFDFDPKYNYKVERRRKRS
jgi:hypothetical protein